ncbi:signal peptidase I [Hyphomonas sp.]|uniref:signal peptidase I n=1 Tax=Hyphomonas sp. TaxID=87 RepID=UPI00261C2BDA|nr:signal peptidase I [Hyphomonas sp.]MDF1805787.1 signal peptidase I [Hyphomonas sp.]
METHAKPRSEWLTWRRVQMLWAILLMVIAFSALNYTRERWGFGLNMTESLPNWAFIVDSEAIPSRGNRAMFQAPDNPYYDGQPFVKIVAGMPGDLVENRDGEIFVAGHYVGRAKSHSRDGRPLEAIETQNIPDGFVFMMGTHVDSYDSRYAEIGLIPVERIIGRAYPVL